MSVTALQDLDDAQTALATALAGSNVETIEAATAAVALAVDKVRGAGGWKDRPDLRADLQRVLKRAETTRGRINVLADSNRRRFEKLISLTGATPPVSYGRSGRLS